MSEDEELTPPPTARARIFDAFDHYNAAAEALQHISHNHEDPAFGIAQATIMVQIAQVHATLGQLKLNLDRGC